MINFNIAAWRAWAPGLDSVADWQAWSQQPSVLAASNAAPDVSFLPAMQRRRLSRLARMAFSVGWPLAQGHEALPLVFASRHGETPRTFDILSDLAASQPLSPTQFSLSVHNAVIGLWSIMRGETSEMTAIAAAGDGLEHGLIEACALAAGGWLGGNVGLGTLAFALLIGPLCGITLPLFDRERRRSPATTAPTPD